MAVDTKGKVTFADVSGLTEQDIDQKDNVTERGRGTDDKLVTSAALKSFGQALHGIAAQKAKDKALDIQKGIEESIMEFEQDSSGLSFSQKHDKLTSVLSGLRGDLTSDSSGLPKELAKKLQKGVNKTLAKYEHGATINMLQEKKKALTTNITKDMMSYANGIVANGVVDDTKREGFVSRARVSLNDQEFKVFEDKLEGVEVLSVANNFINQEDTTRLKQFLTTDKAKKKLSDKQYISLQKTLKKLEKKKPAKLLKAVFDLGKFGDITGAQQLAKETLIAKQLGKLLAIVKKSMLDGSKLIPDDIDKIAQTIPGLKNRADFLRHSSSLYKSLNKSRKADPVKLEQQAKSEELVVMTYPQKVKKHGRGFTNDEALGHNAVIDSLIKKGDLKRVKDYIGKISFGKSNMVASELFQAYKQTNSDPKQQAIYGAALSGVDVVDLATASKAAELGTKEPRRNLDIDAVLGFKNNFMKHLEDAGVSFDMVQQVIKATQLELSQKATEVGGDTMDQAGAYEDLWEDRVDKLENSTQDVAKRAVVGGEEGSIRFTESDLEESGNNQQDFKETFNSNLDNEVFAQRYIHNLNDDSVEVLRKNPKLTYQMSSRGQIGVVASYIENGETVRHLMTAYDGEPFVTDRAALLGRGGMLAQEANGRESSEAKKWVEDNLKLNEIIHGKPVEVKPKVEPVEPVEVKGPGQLRRVTEQYLRTLEGDVGLKIVDDVGVPSAGFGMNFKALQDSGKLEGALGKGYKVKKVGGKHILFDSKGNKVKKLTLEQRDKALKETVLRVQKDITENLGVDGSRVFNGKDQVSRFLTFFAWHGKNNVMNKELRDVVEKYYKDPSKPSSHRDVLKVAVPWSMERLAKTLKGNNPSNRNGLVNRTMAQLATLMGAEPFSDPKVYDQAKPKGLLGFNKKWEIMLRESKVTDKIEKYTLEAAKTVDSVHLKELIKLLRRYKRAS